MDWNNVFYIAEHNNGYAVMISPNEYVPYARYYQMNTVTTYEACLELIKKYVTEYGTAEQFYDACSQMYDGFRVESKPELARREFYWFNNAKEIAAKRADIAAVVAEAQNTRVIRGDNVTAVVTNVNKGEGKRKVLSVTGPQEWLDFCERDFFGVILKFKGHTKKELHEALSNALEDVESMNDFFAALKQHGVKSIGALKALTRADLYLYLTDFVNELVM